MTDSSRLAGVYPTKKKDGTLYYRASMTHKGKHISLGSYPSMEDAHTAYLEACSLLKPDSMPPLSITDYGAKHYKLLFEKWVSLVNLRDNGIYFSTPIYMRKNYFEYHLSPDFIFKFDLDDLFYYSSHKIMQRNGHFFVADYGMQYNIMNRYGIKNYAVCGRDYLFVNGDATDMRYENIQILNTYHGVTRMEKNGKLYFQARIHIRGSYLIGTYETSTEAAIAYNKAIDILKKNGVTKNYTPNYIENLSAKVYADIYSELEISDKIKRMAQLPIH